MVELFMNKFGKDVVARDRGLIVVSVPMWCVCERERERERCMENDQNCEESTPADLPNTKKDYPLDGHAKELI
jgi:hypothetical protein